MKFKLSYDREAKHLVDSFRTTQFMSKCFSYVEDEIWLEFTEKEFLDKISVLAKFFVLEITHSSLRSYFTLFLRVKPLLNTE